MRYSNRLFLYAPFVILLIIAAAAIFRWKQVANEWESRLLAAENGSEIAPGVTLHFASKELGGFPFNIDVVLNNFAVTVRSTRGPISLASERFAIHALTYGRAQQVMEAAGLQTLTWTDAEGGTHAFAFVPGSLHASAIERDGHLARFDLDLNTFESRALNGVRAQLHIRATPLHDALDFVLRADHLRAKYADAVLPHVDIEGRITPFAALIPLLSARDEWRRALGNWRTADGALRLDHVDIAWNVSHLAASGAFTLDMNNRVSGDLGLQLFDAKQWKPARLVKSAFTSALQELAQTSPSPLRLSLDIHNGAAIVRANGTTRSVGSIDPMF